LRAAPRLSVTFHTVFQCEAFNHREYFRELLKRNLAKAIAMRAQYNREHLLSARLACPRDWLAGFGACSGSSRSA